MLFFKLPHNYYNVDPEDFSSAIATTVVFAAGTSPGGPGSRLCINVPITNDQRVELTESFSVSVGPNTLDFPSGSVATITILDDDGININNLNT